MVYDYRFTFQVECCDVLWLSASSPMVNINVNSWFWDQVFLSASLNWRIEYICDSWRHMVYIIHVEVVAYCIELQLLVFSGLH